MGYAARGAFQHRIDTRPAELARFVFGGLLVHDAIVVPLVLGVGLVVARWVPRPFRSVVQVGVLVSACLTVYAYPLVRGYGHAAHNPSSLPHRYAANLALVLTGVVAVAGAALAVLGARSLRRRHGAAGGGPDAKRSPSRPR
jgi:hypothetical protein